MITTDDYQLMLAYIRAGLGDSEFKYTPAFTELEASGWMDVVAKLARDSGCNLTYLSSTKDSVKFIKNL